VKKAASGQGLVEFALVLPVLLLLIIGVLDFGAAFFVKVELENSAREGANYMVYNAASVRTGGFGAIQTAVQIEGENSGITIPTGNIDVKCINAAGTAVTAANCASGFTIVVNARYTMPLAVDIFLNGPLQLVGDARMMVP